MHTLASVSSKQLAIQIALHQKIVSLQGPKHRDFSRHQQDIKAMSDELARRAKS